MNLILCGLPGAGKSTTSRLLAKRLGWPLIETDELLEQKCGATCRETHLKIGENRFREIEFEILQTLSGTHQIIDIGGGMLTYPPSAELLRTFGRFIYLQVDLAVAFERKLRQGMPSFLDPKNPYKSYLKLALQRELIYERYSNLTIEATALSPTAIVESILDFLSAPQVPLECGGSASALL